MVTGKEGEESRIIGTSFEQEYGPVSQTYNILLFTHTTFMSDIKTNIYIILKGAVTDPRWPVPLCFFEKITRRAVGH